MVTRIQTQTSNIHIDYDIGLSIILFKLVKILFSIAASKLSSTLGTKVAVFGLGRGRVDSYFKMIVEDVNK